MVITLPQPKRAALRRHAPLLLTLLAAGAVVWAVAGLDRAAVQATFARADLALLVAAFGAVLAIHVTLAARWQIVVSGGPGSLRLARIQLESHFWATFVPGGVAQDGYRILALRRLGMGTETVAASVIAERALGLAGLLVLLVPTLVVASSLLGDALLAPMTATAAGLAALLTTGTLLVLIAPIRRGRLRWLPARLHRSFGRLEQALGAYRRSPLRLLGGIGFALAYQACHLAAYLAVGHALGVELSIVHWLVVVPLAAAAGALPLNVGGIGAREGALGLLLLVAGVPPVHAAAVPLVVGIFQFAVGGAGGFSHLLRHAGRLLRRKAAARLDPAPTADGAAPELAAVNAPHDREEPHRELQGSV